MYVGLSSDYPAPRFVLRGDNGEGFVRSLIALPGDKGVQLEISHTSEQWQALRFCTDKAAKRFAIAVAAHYPLTMHGRYTVVRM